ncbi:hypothetical protein FACS189440_22240 [Bacteroidia bacterium]|nr:hypothetical protein FACS189440_22240 [Bacteroidia bacterium]
MHLTVGTEVNPIHTENFEAVSFAPILEEAQRLNLSIQTHYDVTNDVGQYVVNRIKQESFEFLLVGAGISMSALPQDIEAAKHTKWFYPGALVKDKTRQFIEEAQCSVGVFVNRDFEKANDVIVILKKPKDVFLFRYAKNVIAFNQAKISILELGDALAKNRISEGVIREFLNTYPSTTFIRSTSLPVAVLSKKDLMLISYETWTDISDHEKEALQAMPSTLIIRKSI